MFHEFIIQQIYNVIYAILFIVALHRFHRRSQVTQEMTSELQSAVDDMEQRFASMNESLSLHMCKQYEDSEYVFDKLADVTIDSRKNTNHIKSVLKYVSELKLEIDHLKHENVYMESRMRGKDREPGFAIIGFQTNFNQSSGSALSANYLPTNISELNLNIIEQYNYLPGGIRNNSITRFVLLKQLYAFCNMNLSLIHISEPTRPY